jgi:hypothetical protein
MAVDSDYVRDLVDRDRVKQLCRELEQAAVEPLLHFNSDGVLASGVSLSANASTMRESQAAAIQFNEQVLNVLADGLPLSVRVCGLGADRTAYDGLSWLCEQLRRVVNDTSASPSCIELVVDASSMPPEAAWLTRRDRLGDGPLYLVPQPDLMRADHCVQQRRRHERFWYQFWHLRSAGSLRAALAPFVLSGCPLLSAEIADSIAPAAFVQAPTGSAWISMQLDLSKFANVSGDICEANLERTLRRAVEIGDELHELTTWPTPQMRHDAWLNRRLAIVLTGFGDLAWRRKTDPRRFASLESLCELLRWMRDCAHAHSRKIARGAEPLPALEQADPSHSLPGGQVRNGWKERWRDAVEIAAVRHRNVVVLSPWSVFPRDRPADFSYTDLLPLLEFADACSFPAPPPLAQWNLNKFKHFHQRAWAVLHERDTPRQIAEGL